jgi:hypothetical protein
MAVVYINGSRPPYAGEAVSGLTTAKGFTAATYNSTPTSTDSYDRYSQTKRPEEAFVQFKNAAVNWTIDGRTPTTTATTDVGFVHQAGDCITLVGNTAIVAFRAINSVASSGATVEVTYFR